MNFLFCYAPGMAYLILYMIPGTALGGWLLKLQTDRPFLKSCPVRLTTPLPLSGPSLHPSKVQGTGIFK